MEYLKSLRLKNMQSWKDLTLDLTEGLNVIQGPNNSGKSVPFKVFKKMCFNNFGGRNARKGLIRTGCDKGEAWLDYGKFVVKYELYPTYQVYRLLNSDGHEIDSWQQNELPEKLKNLMGWYTDSDYNILLNLTGQGNSLPFADSSPSFNARVLKFLTESPELEISKTNFKDWMDSLTVSRNVEDTNIRVMEGLSSSYAYKDLNTFRSHIDKKKKVLETGKFFFSLYKSIDSIVDAELPSFVFVDKEKIEWLLELETSLNIVKESLEKSEGLDKPDFNFVDKQKMDLLLGMNDKFSNNKWQIYNLMKAEREFERTRLKKVNKERVGCSLSLTEKFSSMHQSLKEVCKLEQESLNNKIELKKITERLDMIRKELGVCPLCNNELK